MRDESSSTDTTRGGETPEQALRSAVDRHGPALFFERAALGAYLEQRCPDGASDIALLLAGLEEQVPQDLLGARTDDDLKVLVGRLERRLVERRALNAYAASWVVEAWLRALRLPAVSADTTTPAAPDLDIATAPAAPPTAIPAVSRAARHPEPPAPRPVAEQVARREPAGRVAGLPRRYGLAGAVLLALIAAFLVWREAEAPQQSAAPLPAPTAPQAAATPAPPPPAAAPLPEIVDVTSDEPLTGDGRPRRLFVTLKDARDDIRTVESRFVDGDAVLRAQAAIVGDAPSGNRMPAGTIGLRSTSPVEATFEFIVTTTDGRRSAPFVKELSIAAVPAVAPVITDVVIPANVVAGAPFTAAIGARPGDAKVASIERTIIGAKGKAGTDVRVVDVSTLRLSDDGKLALPMRAASAPSTMTMDLVLIDADGVRSEPKRIAVDVGSSGVAVATGSCTPATCGGVVAVRELADATIETRLADAFAFGAKKRDRAGGKQYEIQVQTDDGVTRTIRQASPWQKGDRVRLVGGKLSALEDPSTVER